MPASAPDRIGDSGLDEGDAGEEDGSLAKDSGFEDTGAPFDTGFPPNDAGVEEDTGFSPNDTGVGDTGFPPNDTGVVDTGVPTDSGVVDTGFPDTGFPDAGFPDAGFFPDGGFPNLDGGGIGICQSVPELGMTCSTDSECNTILPIGLLTCVNNRCSPGCLCDETPPCPSPTTCDLVSGRCF